MQSRNRYRMGSAIAIGAISLSTLGLASCGKASQTVSDKAIEHATGAKVDSKNGSVHVQTKDGDFTAGEATSLPSGWPKDALPVPSGFKVKSVVKSNNAQGNSQLVSLEGSGDVTKISDGFVKALKNSGAEIGMQSSAGGSAVISATKGTTTYAVTVSNEGSGPVTITMTWTTEPTK